MIFARFLFAGSYTSLPISAQCPTGEWLRGDNLCTYKGLRHLAWSVPM